MTEQAKQLKGVLTIRRMLMILCGLAFLLGLRNTMTVNPHPINLLLVWAMDVLTILICAQDARHRGGVLLNSYRWIMFFTWPASIWIYYFWSRGLKGLGFALLWSLILSASYVAGGVVVMFILW